MAEMDNDIKETEIELRSIKSMFESGEIKRMYDIAKLYPTKIIRALGLNYGRYIDKLAKPERFVMNEIIRFSLLIGVDHNKVIEIITREAVPNVKAIDAAKKTRKGKATQTKDNGSKLNKKKVKKKASKK